MRLRKDGHKVIIVSSGAIGVGLRRMDVEKRPKHLAKLQVGGLDEILQLLVNEILTSVMAGLGGHWPVSVDEPLGQSLHPSPPAHRSDSDYKE